MCPLSTHRYLLYATQAEGSLKGDVIIIRQEETPRGMHELG